jgi:transcription initiation factor TFIIIB Brf1 subunit/transcription initiation factor TFIIB
MSGCSHTNEIIDHHEGTIICTDCGIVKDTYYDIIVSKNDFLKRDSLNQIENIMDHLHLPEEFTELINNNLSKSKNKNSRMVNQRRRIFSVKKLATEIYNTVNDKNSNLLLKDISNFSHISPHQIKSKNILLVNLEEVLERYTAKFNMNFQTYTVIKDELNKFKNTGFQPLTIIGGLIYLHFLNIKKKISMRKISEILGISSISIQRFLRYNNEISSRK